MPREHRGDGRDSRDQGSGTRPQEGEKSPRNILRSIIVSTLAMVNVFLHFPCARRRLRNVVVGRAGSGRAY